MDKKYNGKQMIQKSRMTNYFNTLDTDIKNDIISRINELVIEENGIVILQKMNLDLKLMNVFMLKYLKKEN